MEKRDKEEMSRRKFLKIVGVSAAASAAALYGCASEGKPASSEASVLGEVPVDKMTYRVCLNMVSGTGGVKGCSIAGIKKEMNCPF